MQKQVSIVITTYGRTDYLMECVKSLLTQSYSDIELIIVGDHSLKKAKRRIRRYFPSVIFLILNRPFGTAKAFNHGIDFSKSRYVALLNDDTQCDSQWLSRSIQSLEKEPENVICCAPKIKYLDRRKTIYAAGDDFCIETGHATNRGNGQHEDSFNQKQYVSSACAAAAVFKRSIFKVLGAFDEDLYAYYEDVELGIRSRFSGYRIIYDPLSVVYHVGGGSDWGSRAVYLNRRNSILILARNYPRILLKKFGHKIVLNRIMVLFKSKTPMEFFMTLKAYVDAIVLVPQFLKKNTFYHCSPGQINRGYFLTS